MIIRLCGLIIFPLLAGCGSMTALSPRFGEALNLGYPEFPLPPSSIDGAVFRGTLPPLAVMPERPNDPAPRQTYEPPMALSSSPARASYDPAKDLYLTTARVGVMPMDKSSDYTTGANGKIVLPHSISPPIIEIADITRALAE